MMMDGRDKVEMERWGRSADVRRHGWAVFALFYGIGVIAFLAGLQDEADRIIAWSLGAGAIAARHILGAPFVTVELAVERLRVRGFARQAEIPFDEIEQVLFGTGEYSSASFANWPREAAQPLDHNANSSRFVVVVLRRFRWGLGKKLLVPMESPEVADDLVASLRRTLSRGTPYRGAQR